MVGAQTRGFLAFAVALAAIAYLWVRFDRETEAESVTAEPAITTTVPVTTDLPATTGPDDADLALERVCDQASEFQAAASTLPEDAGDGPVVEMAADFWSSVVPDLPVEVRTEGIAVVGYYDSFLEVAQPFEYDPVRIIVEGDKERYEQLLTRPAPGLENARGFVLFTCGAEVPDKPSMSESGFRSLEERLLDPDPLE